MAMPWNNDQEYAFGGNPKAVDALGYIGLAPTADGNMLITYVRRKNDPALIYTRKGR